MEKMDSYDWDDNSGYFCGGKLTGSEAQGSLVLHWK